MPKPDQTVSKSTFILKHTCSVDVEELSFWIDGRLESFSPNVNAVLLRENIILGNSYFIFSR